MSQFYSRLPSDSSMNIYTYPINWINFDKGMRLYEYYTDLYIPIY